jgi:hypothetical protein
MSTVPKLERLLFSQSRDREYFDANELRTMTGQPVERFPDVVVKELGDNGLDAAEMKRVAPKIIIQVWWREKDVVIRVRDNAGGIKPETVERILDFKTRTSDKAAYRSTTRGLQGNALKTIIGMPYALGSKKPVLIDARGKKFVIRPHVDPAGVAHIAYPCHNSEDAGGTTWTVSLPLSVCGKTDFAKWARAFALFNPHAIVKFREIWTPGKPASTAARKRTKIYNPLVRFPSDEWKKFLPTDLIPVHWYDLPSFARLVFSYIANAREGGPNLTLRKFIALFPGFKGSERNKHITDQFPEIGQLDDFVGREERVGDLLRAMQSAPGIKKPNPELLGFVGKSSFLSRLNGWHGVTRTGEGKPRFWYETAYLEVDGIPYVFEVAVAQTERPGHFFHGVNFSPTFEDPLSGTHFKHVHQKKGSKTGATDEIFGYGARGFLDNCHAIESESWHDKLPFHSAAAIHLVCPAPQFMDKAKTRIKLPQEVITAVAGALFEAAKTLWQEGERRKKDAAKQARADRERDRVREAGEMPLTEAVPLAMPEALDQATGDGAYIVSQHTLYYHVRREVQQYTKRFLTKENFEGKILPAYKLAHPEVRDRIYAEARGTLYEPHTGVALELGTREVKAYKFPDWRYRKILFIEKQGLWPIFNTAKLAERFDMAIIAGEGYATEACRVLFQNAQKGKYMLFVLHDADPYGYEIARTLSEETARMPGYEVDVIDLGLTLADALALDLGVEEFTRKKALSQALTLTEMERQYFTGVRKGANTWLARRVELNAFTAPGLIDYTIAGLVKHGATEKLIPPEDELPDLVQKIYDVSAQASARTTLDEFLSLDDMCRQVAEDFRGKVPLDKAADWIEKALAKDQTLSWDGAVRLELAKVLARKQKQLRRAVLEKLMETIEELDL